MKEPMLVAVLRVHDAYTNNEYTHTKQVRSRKELKQYIRRQEADDEDIKITVLSIYEQ